MRDRRPPLLAPGWRRRPIVYGTLLALLLLSIADHVAGPRRAGSDYQRYHGKMFRIVDVPSPDSLLLETPDGDPPQTRVRLWGLAAARPADAERALSLARRRLRDRTVRIELAPTRSRDDGGAGDLRAYAYLVDSGEMVNEQFLRDRIAPLDPRADHPFAERFREVDRRARRPAR